MIIENKLLSEMTTFGVGGPARFYTEIRTINEAKEAINFAKEHKIPFHILGKGSNSLFEDRGYSGLVILNKIDFFNEPEPGYFHVGAGYSFSLLGIQTARKGWSGLEFASGIPGSVGGAVFMNAGANGNEVSSTLEAVDFLSDEGVFQTLQREQLNFSYRSSIFQRLPGIITGAYIKLFPNEKARKRQLEIIDYRKHSQPYKDKSAGCIFRNPLNLSAGALIENVGLKGKTIGNAKVSEKHANFIINSGNATCDEILRLIALVKKQVKEQTGVELESEVRYIPYE